MQNNGRFFLIGGGPLAWEMGNPLMRRFVQEAGGSNADIALLTAGSDDPEGANEVYWHMFLDLGAGSVFSPAIRNREDALDGGIAERMQQSTAVFIAGGSQENLTARLAGTPVEQALRDLHARGGLLAGTSSGSSILGHPMILDGGNRDKHLREGMIDIGDGFAILADHIAIDTHFSSRGRVPRNLALLRRFPHAMAIGIDEDTALLIDAGRQGEVIGRHAVYVLDLAHSPPPAGDRANPGVHHVALHCLTEGERFDLRQRQPLPLAG